MCRQLGCLQWVAKPPSNVALLLIVCFLFGAFAVSEFIAGVVANSTSLLEDALTMVVDSMTYLLNMYAERKKDKGVSEKEQLKMEFYFPLISVVTLFCVCLYGAGEAMSTITSTDGTASSSDPENETDSVMLLFSTINLIIDIGSLLCFARVNRLFGYNSIDVPIPQDDTMEVRALEEFEEEREDYASNTNMCSAYTHVLADTLRSLTVMIAAIVSLTNRNVDAGLADAWAALFVTLLIFLSTIPLLRGLYFKWSKLSRLEQSSQDWDDGDSNEPLMEEYRDGQDNL